MAKKVSPGIRLKAIIRQHLLDEGHLREEIKDPKFEFGFKFQYPISRDATGKEFGRNFVVIKPKNKDLIEVSHGFHLGNPHDKIFDSLDNDKKNHFFNEITKIFHIKELGFSINFTPERKVFVVVDKIYVQSGKAISKNPFYKTIKKIYGTVMYCIAIINEILSGKPGDLSLGEKRDPSIYT